MTAADILAALSPLPPDAEVRLDARPDGITVVMDEATLRRVFVGAEARRGAASLAVTAGAVTYMALRPLDTTIDTVTL